MVSVMAIGHNVTKCASSRIPLISGPVQDVRRPLPGSPELPERGSLNPEAAQQLKALRLEAPQNYA